MKQKYKVSCHSREMESTDEDVHLKVKKKVERKVDETPAEEKDATHS